MFCFCLSHTKLGGRGGNSKARTACVRPRQRGPAAPKALRLITVPSDGPQPPPKGRQSWCMGNRGTRLDQGQVHTWPLKHLNSTFRAPSSGRNLLDVFLQPQFQRFSPRRDKGRKHSEAQSFVQSRIPDSLLGDYSGPDMGIHGEPHNGVSTWGWGFWPNDKPSSFNIWSLLFVKF